MSFPYHDRFWCDTADFIERHAARREAILAPDIFWWRFPKIYRYINTRHRPGVHYDWIVLHKGLLDELPASFVVQSYTSLCPVFANEVFVVLGRSINNALPADHPHLASFAERLSELAAREDTPSPPTSEQPVLPEPGAIFKFSELDPEQLAEAMDEFWLQGGYVYSTLRDKTYYAEIDRYIREFVGDGHEQAVLDLGCGIGRLGGIVCSENRVTGVDISGAAIEMAKERHRGSPNFSFERMDAHRLSFSDASFDVVLFIDAIEHVANADKVFAEISRVLKPGGLMLVTVANRDSVNQILTTKLGNPEFVTNYQHIREFSYAETLGLLRHHGFLLERSAGIFLYPYWGVPGIDEMVRNVTDNDPEFVELMRVLGERVGAEHAYCSVVLGRKRS